MMLLEMNQSYGKLGMAEPKNELYSSVSGPVHPFLN